MKTFAISSALVIGAFILFVVGMFSGDGGLMMAIFCTWTPLIGFWGFSFGRLRLRIVIDEQVVMDNKVKAKNDGSLLKQRESRIRAN
jgi:hypothetical protein